MGESVTFDKSETPVQSRVFIHKECRERNRLITLEEPLPLDESSSRTKVKFRVKDLHYRDFDTLEDAEKFFFAVAKRKQ